MGSGVVVVPPSSVDDDDEVLSGIQSSGVFLRFWYSRSSRVSVDVNAANPSAFWGVSDEDDSCRVVAVLVVGLSFRREFWIFLVIVVVLEKVKE